MKWRIFEGNKILKEIWRIFWQCEGNLKEILIKPAPLKNFICNITVADAIQTKEVKHQSTMARLLANDNKNNPQATTKLLLESQPSCIACVLMLLWNDKRQKRSLEADIHLLFLLFVSRSGVDHQAWIVLKCPTNIQQLNWSRIVFKCFYLSWNKMCWMTLTIILNVLGTQLQIWDFLMVLSDIPFMFLAFMTSCLRHCWWKLHVETTVIYTF